MKKKAQGTEKSETVRLFVTAEMTDVSVSHCGQQRAAPALSEGCFAI
jgi:hypothetical protein